MIKKIHTTSQGLIVMIRVVYSLLVVICEAFTQVLFRQNISDVIVKNSKYVFIRTFMVMGKTACFPVASGPF